jgi:hypothetical protein
MALGLQFGEQVAKAIQGHLINCKLSIKQDLLKLDNREADRALEIADKQLRSKMGNKLTDADKKTWLTEAKGMLNTPRESTPKVTKSASVANPNPNPNPKAGACEDGKGIKPEAAKVNLYNLSNRSGGTPAKKPRMETSPVTSSGEETLSLPGTPYKPQVIKRVKFTGKDTVKPCPKPLFLTINMDIKPTCKILFLGDDSLNGDPAIPQFPEGIQKMCFPTATFSDLDWVIKHLAPFPENVKHICIATAANYDQEGLDSNLVPEYNDLMETLEQVGQDISFLEIPVPLDLLPEAQTMLKNLNNHISMENVGAISFIPGASTLPFPLGSSSVYFNVEYLVDEVIYDFDTLKELTNRLISHFLD